MSMQKEIRKIAEEYTANNRALTAEAVVEAARNANEFPELNRHLWQVAEATLAREARIARAHRLLISIRIVHEEGAVTRLLVHTPGTAGYSHVEKIAGNLDLATLKLRQLADDIARSRARFRNFKAFVPIEVSDEIDMALEKAELAAAAASKRDQVAAA